MQFHEGGATGPNGQDSRNGQNAGEPTPETGGRGSLMSRYRGSGAPAPDAEEAAATPPLPRPGEQPMPADSPWRQSNWTSAPPVPSNTPPSPPLPAPSAPAADIPVADKPADKPVEKPVDKVEEKDATAVKTDLSPAKPAEAPKPVEPPKPAEPVENKKPTEPVEDKKPAEDKPVEDERAEAKGEPAVTITRGTTPGAATTASAALLTSDETSTYKDRWRDLQAEFVDDPQQAVRGAGQLARDVLGALSDRIADADRVESWQAEDGTSGTEDLRVALRRYRNLVDRLLEL